MLSVAHVMTETVYTLTPDHSVADAWELMSDHHIHHLPIADEDGTLRGLISQHDLLKQGKSSSKTLGEIMITHVQTIDKHEPVRSAAMIMHQKRLRCLPVVDKERLIGIVTDTDFVAVAIHLMEQLELSEPEPDDDLIELDSPNIQ